MAKPGWEQSTAYKNNRERGKHRLHAVESAAGSVGAAVGAHQANKKHAYKFVQAHEDTYRGNLAHGDSQVHMASAKKFHAASNYHGKGTEEGNAYHGHAIDRAKAAGEATRRGDDYYRSAGKALDASKNWKKATVGAAAASTALAGNVFREKHTIKQVRPKQLARDKAAKLSKRSNLSAFGIEH